MSATTYFSSKAPVVAHYGNRHGSITADWKPIRPRAASPAPWQAKSQESLLPARAPTPDIFERTAEPQPAQAAPAAVVIAPASPEMSIETLLDLQPDAQASSVTLTSEEERELERPHQGCWAALPAWLSPWCLVLRLCCGPRV